MDMPVTTLNADLKAALAARVGHLEEAVIAIGTQELGDTPGHDFHGNQWSGGGASPLAEHLVKAPREAAIVDSARASGLIPPKGSVKAYQDSNGAYHYGSSSAPIAVLPTQTKIHLARPEENEYGVDHAGHGTFIVAQSNETGHLRALFTSGEAGPAAQVGQTIHLQHDQTGARIGGYSGHEVVGLVHPDGTAEGVVPDRKIAYSVFK
jgi:hypothetical protein